MKILNIVFALLTSVGMLFAQETGRIKGTIKDKSTKDVLLGANVLLKGTKIGTTTDIDGNFLLKNIPVGTYTLQFSCVGYTLVLAEHINVEKEKTLQLNVELPTESIQQKEVVVEGKAMIQTESAIINQRKKSYAISDGISQEQLRKTTDATSGDALRRVVGLSLIDNKFINIRGINERYNATVLDNVSVTSSEPDKKAFSFDMIPSAMLENTMVSKSFIPNMPGNFSGGLVQLNTVEFPSTLNIRLSVSDNYNTVSSFKDFSTNSGHPSNLLALSSTGLPSSFPDGRIDVIAAKKNKYGLNRLLSNDWSPGKVTAPPSGNYSFSIGNSYILSDNELGFIAALSYRNVFSSSSIERNDWAVYNSAQGKPIYEQRLGYKGDKYDNDILWGGVFNINYKFSDLYKMSIKSLYNRSGNDEVTSLHGEEYNNGQEQQHSYQQTTLRSVSSLQVNGELRLPQLRYATIQWRAFNSSSTRNEPDFRRLIYARSVGTNDPYRAKLSVAFPQLDVSRFYSTLSDNGNGLGFDITIPMDEANIKIGYLYDKKDRNFRARFFGYFFDSFSNFAYNDSMQRLSPQDLFQPSNIDSGKLGFDEIYSGSNKYSATHEVDAAYGMTELPFSVFEEHFRFIGGARVEHSIQHLITRSQDDLSKIESNLDNDDILPSLNLVYMVRENTTMKFAYSKTVGRPEFRELASFSFYDFTTNQLVFGNPALQRTLIANYDWRVEYFPLLGEIFSINAFYKNFENAIEEVNINSSSNNLVTFANASSAKNYGVEIETRKSLLFIDSSMRNIYLSGNYSRIFSTVSIPQGAGQLAETRPMQGQSPYLINIGLSLTTNDNNSSLNLFYNKFGRRIAQAGIQTDINLERVDIYEEAFDQLDITCSHNFSNSIVVKLSANNILNQDRIFSYGEKTQKRDVKGMAFGIGFTLAY